MPEATPDLKIPPSAVDLSTFDPKREKREEQSAALGGRTVRSLGTGVASYYGKRFHGRLTANGERFNMRAMTAAHKTLPFGTKIRVTNPRNGRAVIVRINDRGPFIRGRTIDLSRGAAEKIGMISSGHARVKLEIVR
ncbi:MAG: septal ring lytic transglycosylase RlpA family protein [Pseudomonadota bacterium]